MRALNPARHAKGGQQEPALTLAVLEDSSRVAFWAAMVWSSSCSTVSDLASVDAVDADLAVTSAWYALVTCTRARTQEFSDERAALRERLREVLGRGARSRAPHLGAVGVLRLGDAGVRQRPAGADRAGAGLRPNTATTKERRATMSASQAAVLRLL